MLFRWRPRIKCTRSFPPGSECKMWNPEENEVLIAANDPMDVALKHFECLGEYKEEEVSVHALKQVGDMERLLTSNSATDELAEYQRKKEIIANERNNIDKYSDEERAEMIRRKAEGVDPKDKTCWYRGVPTAREMSSRLPFTVTYEEIKKAMGKK